MTLFKRGDVVLIGFPFAGLPKQSVVKLGKLITIDQRLIGKKLGHVSTPTQSLIRDILHEII